MDFRRTIEMEILTRYPSPSTKTSTNGFLSYLWSDGKFTITGTVRSRQDLAILDRSVLEFELYFAMFVELQTEPNNHSLAAGSLPWMPCTS